MSARVSRYLIDEIQASMGEGRLYAPKTDGERRALRRMESGNCVIQPYPGLFGCSESWSELPAVDGHRFIIRSLARLHPNWVFCCNSAAVLHGIDLPFQALRKIDIAAGCSVDGPCLNRHHMRHPDDVTIDGVRVTSFERTAFQCMRMRGFRRALGIADSALRVAMVPREELFERVRRCCRHTKGLTYVHDVLSYADPRSENGGESYARAVMIEHGVMPPQLQVEHVDSVLNVVYRVDYEWELPFGIVDGELDGIQKYTRIAAMRGMSPEQVMAEERQRESRLRNQGIKFARFTFEQVVRVDPFLRILDSCGVPRMGMPVRVPEQPTGFDA